MNGMPASAWVRLGGLLLTGGCVMFALAAEEAPGPAPAWREDFPVPAECEQLPAGWEIQTKFGVRAAKFTIRAAPDAADGVLAMTADRASASVVVKLAGVDLRATPLLRWRWRVLVLPAGGDGRQAVTDDQAIGIYAGTGNLFRQQAVSYRWDTATPKAAIGDCVYGGGIVRIHWFTLRNQADRLGEWQVEERNLAEDFQAAWGTIPATIYLNISCNSQYTGTQAAAELDWIELAPAPVAPPGPAGERP